MRLPGRIPSVAVTRYLLPHERLLLSAHPHPATLLQPVTIALGGILAATVAIVVPHDSGLARILAWALALFLVLRLMLLVASWGVQFVALTSTRLMLISGAFNTRVTSFDVQDLRYCTFERSFGGRLLGYGAIVFDAAGRNRTLVEFLPYSEQIYLIIYGMLSPPSEESWGDDED
jgi:hypothetical protein